MVKIRDLTVKLWKHSKLPLKITSLALLILLGAGKIQTHEHTPENIKKYATEIMTDSLGYKHWKIDGVWYSNKPILHSGEIYVPAAPDSYRVFNQTNDTNLIPYDSGSADVKNANQSSLDSLIKNSFRNKVR